MRGVGLRAVAAGAVLATVALTVGGTAYAGTGQIRTAERPAAPTVSGEVLGPDGYKSLKLGMTEADAVATGELGARRDVPPDACPVYDLRDWPSGGAVDGAAVVFSPDLGLVAIWAYPGVHTPEGIGLGSTVAEAKAAFPGYHDGSPYTNDGAPVPGNSRAYYGIGRRAGDSGRIISLYLASNDERCFNN